MCPMPDNSSTTIQEEDEEFSDTEMSAVANAAEETAVDDRYNGLLNIIEDLKNQVSFTNVRQGSILSKQWLFTKQEQNWF